jgi:hypothetical protein
MGGFNLMTDCFWRVAEMTQFRRQIQHFLEMSTRFTKDIRIKLEQISDRFVEQNQSTQEDTSCSNFTSAHTQHLVQRGAAAQEIAAASQQPPLRAGCWAFTAMHSPFPMGGLAQSSPHPRFRAEEPPPSAASPQAGAPLLPGRTKKRTCQRRLLVSHMANQ